MTIKLAQVDAFTDEAFMGNPAAVCVLNGPAGSQWMQNLAREINLSATAFLVKEITGYGLRWFTAGAELELCGHGTLASAHILWEWNLVQENEDIEFSTLSGTLYARRTGDLIELDFSAEAAEQCSFRTKGQKRMRSIV